MAKVNSQVNLVMFRDVKNVLFVLHVHRHELVADLGRVFGVVHQAELLSLDVNLQLGVVVQPDALAFNFLAPTRIRSGTRGRRSRRPRQPCSRSG